MFEAILLTVITASTPLLIAAQCRQVVRHMRGRFDNGFQVGHLFFGFLERHPFRQLDSDLKHACVIKGNEVFANHRKDWNNRKYGQERNTNDGHRPPERPFEQPNVASLQPSVKTRGAG